MATDPVCGMYVDERVADLRVVRENRTYYFCSRSCLDTFVAPGQHLRRLRHRLAIAWPASILVVVLTYAVHGSWAIFLAFALATLVQFYVGLDFYRGLIDAVRNHVANMDVLIATGTSAAYGYSVAVLLLPTGLPPVYFFDASSLIVTIILTGNYAEYWTRSRANSALRRLGELVPPVAHRLDSEHEVDIPVYQLVVGDHIRIRPGERIPVDGTIRSGRSEVDNSLLTGEVLPKDCGPGQKVWAGTANGRGALEVSVGKVGPDTFLAHLQSLMSDAELSRVPIQHFADRVAAGFVPAVLVLGVVAAAGWYWAGGASAAVALLVFVSVVITACPCAFGIATPAAVIVATGTAAEAGILFKGRDAIERAGTVDVVLADKTATLTEGQPELRQVLPSAPWTERDVLRLAASVEASSEHPLGRAVINAAQARGIPLAMAERVVAEPGIGVRGTIDGREVVVRSEPGGPNRPPSDPGPQHGPAENAIEGGTSSIVLVNGQPAGWLNFEDPLRPEVPSAVVELRRMGLETTVVSGDALEVVRAVAHSAGISGVRSRVMPDQKVEVVRGLQKEGHRVAFVGDGLNDAPALTAADAGMAIGTGADVAKEAGQVILVRSDFRGVPLALRIARRTLAKIRQNIVWAIAYNAVLLPIAAGLLVPFLGFGVYAVLPVAGAVAMGVSSTAVVLNSLTLRRVRAPEDAALHREPGPEALPA